MPGRVGRETYDRETGPVEGLTGAMGAPDRYALLIPQRPTTVLGWTQAAHRRDPILDLRPATVRGWA